MPVFADMRIDRTNTQEDHPVVGHRFKAWDGHVYFCDSYDPSIGFWMTREDAPAEHRQDQNSKWRRNVSERVIGSTFHRIHGK